MRLHSFSRDNKMIVSCIVSVFLLVLPNPLFSQDLDSNVLILEKTKNLFQEKNYSGAIEEADKGLALYDNQEKDITYVSLLEYKALAYNWLHDNRSAMPIYKEAVTTFCKIKGDNRMSCSMSKNFVSIYMSSGWEAYQDSVFVLCLHNIFKKNCISDDTSYWDNLRYYKYYILSLTGYHSYNVDLDAEYSFASKTNNPTLVEYVNYAKGYWKIHGRFHRGSTTKEKTIGINDLEKIETSLERSSNPAAKYLLQYVFYQMASAADELTEYSLAANYYIKNIKLTQANWHNWRHEDPWDNLYALLKAMENARMYTDLNEYCNIVLADTNTTEKHKKTAFEYQRKTSTTIGKETIEDITSYTEENNKADAKMSVEDSIIFLYENNQLTQQYIDSLNMSRYKYDKIDFTKIIDYLFEHKDYPMIIKIESGYYNIINDSLFNFTENITKNVCLEKGIDISQWGDFEERIDALRDTWHRHMGGDYVWATCQHLALAHYYLNDMKNAIKYQQEVVDIVKLNWEYMPNERKEELDLMHIDDDSGMPEIYMVVEQNMYDDLAYFHLMAKDYKSAYYNYKIKLDAIREIIENQIVYGSTNTKNQTWEKWNYYILNIIAATVNYVDEYPPFADLLLECNSIIKGFMLNIHTETHNVAKTQGGKILRYYNRRNGKEKTLEESYYIESGELSSLFAEIGRLNIELNDTIDFPSIVHNVWQYFSTIEKKLGDNDVLVDFFAVNYTNNENIEKKVTTDYYTLEDGRTIELGTIHQYSNPTFYATIMRNGWNYPKVVRLGQLANTTFSDGEDLIDHLYYQSEYRTDINTIYRNTTFGAKIWGEVMEKGLVKRGDNIYFCPTSYLNDIAVEYFQDATGSVMSDQYNMYRISTIREMDKPRIGFKKGDKCVAFGNIAYSKTADKKNKRSTKTRKPINMASIPEAMTDRVILDELEPTQDILTIISKKISKAVIVSGVDATEESFYNLSGNSPDILVIATHGYNYEREGLNDEQEKYLYGNRDNTLLSTQERSMYKSGLFMAQSPNDIPTNGMLTAKEISMCALHNTKLAIIAACVSAVGNNTEEGVFGIQRGLKMAGVQSMLVSLWEVDADATKLLIEEFLKQYVKGNDAHESLRMAQQYVRSYESKDKKLMGDKHIYQSPYYWAGFILID